MPVFGKMRSLLVLTMAFALLITYFEQTSPQANALVASSQPARVIRDSIQSGELDRQEATEQVAKSDPAPKQKSPLNLDLPSLEATTHAMETRASNLLDLFKHQTRQKVTYNAELVFDRETGEEITGGKVNIKIPLT